MNPLLNIKHTIEQGYIKTKPRTSAALNEYET
jgi:hypothetical protein